jgi:VWFA-related protein
MKRSGLFIGLVLLWLPSLFLSGLPQEQVKQPVLQNEVSVTLKLIQVYVTDSKGRPVVDLNKDDFVLQDSGREVKITEFEKHQVGPAAAEAVAPPAAAEELAPTATPAARALSRKYFLFFDFAFNNQRGLVKAIEAATHFIDTDVMPGDEVALLSYSMLKGIRFHEYLTADHAKVKETLKSITVKAIAGRASEIEMAYWREAQESLPGSAVAMSQTQSNSQYNWQRQEAKALAEQYILRLTALAKALRMVEGQKNFIFFSSGIPASMIYGSQSGNPARTGMSSRYDTGDPVLRPLNEGLYKELSASNCSFFAFDTRDSAKVASLFDYDEATFEAGGRSGGRQIFGDNGTFQDTTSVFRDDKTTGLDSLKRLSDVTGGKFFSNIRLYSKNLAQVETLTGSFYVLGYYIDESWDGRFHEIKVDVKRKGCEVRAQAGYFSPKPFRECSDLEKRLQLFDLALNERSPFRTTKIASMVTLGLADESGGRLQLMARLPAATLAELAGPEVEFVSLVFDESENLVDLTRTQTDLTRYQGRNLYYSSGVRVPPGRYRSRLVIRNLASGASAVASTPAAVSKPAPSGLSLQSPLLLVPEGNPMNMEAVGKLPASAASWRNFYPYDRTQYAPLVGGVSPGVTKVFVVVPCRVSGEEQAEIALAAYVIDAASGQKLDVPFNLVFKERRGNYEIFFLEFPAEGLPAGSYLLYIHAGYASQPSLTRVQTVFEISS